MDKSFVSVKGSFHKNMSHSEVLSKCTEITWGKEQQCSAQKYFLSDASGAKIRDEILVFLDNSKVPWTLGSYMKLCNTYASRTRLYSVRIGNQVSLFVFV